MANLLGTVSGQLKIDITQAVNAYAKARDENEKTITALSRASTTFNEVGNVLGVAGLAIAAALGAAADEAANFNKEMDYFQAVSGASASAMDQIKAKALELDQTTMFSVQDIAAMFVQLAKSGETTQQILGGVADASVNLAQAAQVPLTDATNDVVAAMSAFNLKTSDATLVANTFAGAANSSILNLTDLATSLKYVGGVANQLGVSFKESTVALDLLGQAGIRGSMGGTELRQIMVSLLGTTKAGATELKKLGIITANNTNLFFDQSGKLKSLSDVFQILQDHMKGMSQEQQLAALKTIFNNRALSAASILTKQGAAGFAEMNAQISKTNAADVAAKRMDNLAGDVHKLTSSLKTMAITAGQPLQNFLRGVVQFVDKLVVGFSHLSPATQANIIHILAITAGLLLLLSALAKTIAFGLKMVKLFQDLAMAGKFLFSVGTAMVNVIRALTVALMENPIALIIVAVIALAVGFYELYKHCKTFRDAINDIGRAFKTGFEATVNWFKKVPQYFEDAWNAIKNAFKAGVDWVKKNWDLLLIVLLGPIGVVITVFRRFGKQILDFFEGLPGKIGHGLATAGKAIGDFFENLPYKIGYALGYALGKLVRWGVDIVQWAEKTGTDFLAAIGNFFEKLPGEIEQWLKTALLKLAQWNQDMYEWAYKTGMKFLEAIGNFFEQLPGNLEKWFTDAVNAVIKWSTEFYNNAVKTGTQFLAAIGNFFQQLPGNIQRFLNQALSDIGTWATNMWNSAISMGENVVNAVGSWFSKLPGNISKIFDQAVQAIKDAIGSAFDAAANFAEGLWNGFKHGLGIHSPSYIEKAMFQITDTMTSETDKINKYVKTIQGLGDKITSSNPAIAAGQYSSQLLNGMGNSMMGQLSQLNALRQALGVTSGYQLSSSAYSGQGGLGGMEGQPTKVLEVNVYNPVAEKTADSATQELRTLASMGAF